MILKILTSILLVKKNKSFLVIFWPKTKLVFYRVKFLMKSENVIWMIYKTSFG